jgi:Sterol-sensing domain of SREBP cleavage-activation
MAFLIIAIQWKIRLYSPFCHRTICLYLALSTRNIFAQIVRFYILKMSYANLYYTVSELGRKKTSTNVIAYTYSIWLDRCAYHATSMLISNSIIFLSCAISNIFSIALLPSYPISKVKLLTYILTNSVIVCFGCPLPYCIA